MSYKTILCHLDSIETAEKLIVASAMIVEQFDGHLTGLYVIPPPPVYAAAEIATPAMLVNYHDQYHHEVSEQLEGMFNRICANRAMVSEWRSIDAISTVSSTVAELGHTTDLVTLTGPMGGSDANADNDELSRIVSANRRPSLIVPAEAQVRTIGSRVLVGWDGGDESTRAVFDALPLLKLAARVDIHRINPTGDERHHLFGTSSELVNTLARHGVTANLSLSVCSVSEIADELLRTAFEMGSDLLVMGAYGHGRLHDILMGSVTKNVLNGANIPVLMSH